jgi:hypothetical protein
VQVFFLGKGKGSPVPRLGLIIGLRFPLGKGGVLCEPGIGWVNGTGTIFLLVRKIVSLC